jgi:hypothetical protein
MDRRDFFAASAAAIAAPMSPLAMASASAADAPSLRGPYIDLTTGKGNMLMRVRLGANLDESKTRWGGTTGIVTGVRPDEKLRDLFGFEVLGVGRAAKQPDGSYRVYHREVILYTDLATGQVIDEYVNPFTDERVKVVHVVNDPWNEHFEEFEPLPPNYGGLNKVEQGPRKPFLMNWSDAGNGMIKAMRNVHLYYRSALQPDKWPRESAGPMSRVSECYTYYVNLADAQNPEKTTLHNHGTWSRTTPWLPWLLMGQAPGHVQYMSMSNSYPTVADIKKPVREYIEKHFPHMLEAPPPESWSKPNLSSLEVYAATQKPAPAAPKKLEGAS